MVIKTTVKQRGPTLPSKRPLGTFYELGKLGLKSLGYYEDIKQYDPGYHLERFSEKYSYKPGKRLTGYVSQTRGFLKKKKFRSSAYRKFNYQQAYYFDDFRWYNSKLRYSKSSKYTTSHRHFGRESGVYYSGSILYN